MFRPFAMFFLAFRPVIAALGVALAMTVLSVTAALAADGVVTAGPLVSFVAPYIEALASGLITALIGWIALVVQRYLGLRIDASHREALHSAAMTGVTQAMSRLQSAADARTLEGRAAVLASAVSWMQASTPGAIGHFGLQPSSLEALAAAKLTDVLAKTPDLIGGLAGLSAGGFTSAAPAGV